METSRRNDFLKKNKKKTFKSRNGEFINEKRWFVRGHEGIFFFKKSDFKAGTLMLKIQRLYFGVWRKCFMYIHTCDSSNIKQLSNLFKVT